MTSKFSKKRLGQHFLHDQTIIQRIIAAIAPQPTQQLVEIGPGKGALTIPLLQQGCFVAVVEVDHELVERLQQKMGAFQQLRIYHANALKFDFQQLVTEGQPLRFVGNLPYNIATQLLFYLLNYASDIQNMVFMLQKEVVERMIAVPSTSDYGRLSVMLQYHCQITKLFDVSANAFHPSPKVQSSVVQLIPYQTPPVDVMNPKRFAQVVTLAFSQRRKTLRNALKSVLDSQEIQMAGINPQARAETLTLAEFAQLANYKDCL